MLPSFGQLCLGLALLSAFACVGATLYAYRVPEPRRARFLISADRASRGVFIALSGAMLTLLALFLTNNFAVDYVASHSRSDQPLAFKISALWGGMQGSVLMWAWMLAAYGVLLANAGRKHLPNSSAFRVHSTAVAAVAGVSLFFIGMNAFLSNPFALLASPPKDGAGLNPLLQNYWMQIHPPTLYIGYVGCTVPWALAFGGLIHRKFDGEWVGFVRKWTLFTWIVLTVGIIMGGAWAYETLGWGGYWAWDPVENASLLPWLTSTAFLHSIMIQARRGTLKSWNMALVTLTFFLSVFGTAMTRSGWVSSVHSFAQSSSIGTAFMGFLSLSVFISVAVLLWRRDELKAEREIESPLSREGAFLLNNWLLVAATAAVLWGTVFPSISEAFGRQVTVNADYYNKIMVPLGLALLMLTGVGPLLAWRKASWASLWKMARGPVFVMLALSPLLIVLARWKTGAATAFLLIVFVVAAIGGEFYRGTKARMRAHGENPFAALANLTAANRHRYGGYIVHLGIAMMFLGIAGSSAFKVETKPLTLRQGDYMSVGEYKLQFLGFGRPQTLDPNLKIELAALMRIVGTDTILTPAAKIYKGERLGDPEASAGQEPQHAFVPSILSNPAHDLYLAMVGYDIPRDEKTKTTKWAEGKVEIKGYLNPLVMWIWISTLLFVVGTIVAAWPGGKKKAVVASPETKRERVEKREDKRVGSPVTAAVAEPNR